MVGGRADSPKVLMSSPSRPHSSPRLNPAAAPPQTPQPTQRALLWAPLATALPAPRTQASPVVGKTPLLPSASSPLSPRKAPRIHLGAAPLTLRILPTPAGRAHPFWAHVRCRELSPCAPGELVEAVRPSFPVDSVNKLLSSGSILARNPALSPASRAAGQSRGAGHRGPG